VNNNYNSNTVVKQDFAVVKQVDGRVKSLDPSLFQLRTTLNGKDFNFFLMGYANSSRTYFFNT
jgi:hypothetical protein